MLSATRLVEAVKVLTSLLPRFASWIDGSTSMRSSDNYRKASLRATRICQCSDFLGRMRRLLLPTCGPFRENNRAMTDFSKSFRREVIATREGSDSAHCWAQFSRICFCIRATASSRSKCSCDFIWCDEKGRVISDFRKGFYNDQLACLDGCDNMPRIVTNAQSRGPEET